MNMTTTIKTYSELIQLKTFEERFRYLKLNGQVGTETFGFDRYINQQFYTRSKEWLSVRREIIIRDNGCDLGIEGRDIYGKIFVHHMNPLSVRDITDVSKYLLNPEYLITVSFETHNAIHYGSEDLLLSIPKNRRPNDTCPWKQKE